MSESAQKRAWEQYVASIDLAIEEPLKKYGFALDDEQPHTLGERFLMQAVTTTSGKKVIFLGKRTSDSLPVVIKATNDARGMKELEEEQKSRKILHEIDFADSAFHTPKELVFERCDGYLLSIHEFIDQESTFLERPVEEQFFFALNAFKAQEGAHAATYGHIRTIRKAFSVFTSESYLANFLAFIDSARDRHGVPILQSAFEYLKENRQTIEQYCGFLVHTDFVPHNIRIKDGKVYLLDHSSIRFGNKYEGWARFLNFMALYNPELEQMLVEYVHNNRTDEEHFALKAMRVYRLGEIITYYIGTLEKSEGALHELNTARIELWHNVLKAILNDTFVDQNIVLEYKKTRDSLRSPDEKLRQKDLH